MYKKLFCVVSYICLCIVCIVLIPAIWFALIVPIGHNYAWSEWSWSPTFQNGSYCSATRNNDPTPTNQNVRSCLFQGHPIYFQDDYKQHFWREGLEGLVLTSVTVVITGMLTGILCTIFIAIVTLISAIICMTCIIIRKLFKKKKSDISLSSATDL